MGKPARRFVARGVKNAGWRVWDNKSRRFWGPTLAEQPDELLHELNGQRRAARLNVLVSRIRLNRSKGVTRSRG